MAKFKKRKQSADTLEHYRLHDNDRPLGDYNIIITFSTMSSLVYHYEYEMKKTESDGLFIIEEQENDKSNPGRMIKLFCLAKK